MLVNILKVKQLTISISIFLLVYSSLKAETLRRKKDTESANFEENAHKLKCEVFKYLILLPSTDFHIFFRPHDFFWFQNEWKFLKRKKNMRI